jgi:hypothetical protein
MSGYTYPDDPGERHVRVQLFAVFAGILIPIVLIMGLWMAISAHQARNDANAAAKAASAGGVFDVQIPKSGIYPFVSHSFASVMLGQVGLLNVGKVPGTMSH